MQQIPFAISTSSARNIKANNETLINMYAETMTPAAKSSVTLIGTPGAELFSDLETTTILGTHVFKDVLYAVTVDELYSIDSAGVSTLIGSVDFTGRDYVSIADNGIQMLMVAGDAYYYDGITSIGQVTDPEYFQSSMVTYMDGYFILVRDGTQQFFISELYSVSFVGTDFASAEGSPDNLIGVRADHRQLWLFGDKSVEVWYNSGNVDFPFERIQGSFQQRGCLEKHTIDTMDNSIYWVGDDGIIYRANGYTPMRISTEAIESEIAQIPSTELSSFTYFEEGHTFYCIAINGNKTLVYDAKTQLWHTRTSVKTGRWIAYGMEAIYGKNIASSDDGKLYEMSIDINTENDVVINREAITSPISKGVDYFTLSEFEIDMETGTSEINVDDELSIQISKDGGRTYSIPRTTSLGEVAKYGTRVVFRRLGRARNMSIKVKTRSKAPVRIISAQARF